MRECAIILTRVITFIKKKLSGNRINEHAFTNRVKAYFILKKRILLNKISSKSNNQAPIL